MNTLIDANVACLGQGIDLLLKFPASIYSRQCPEIFNSSIGGHMRHNLDHYLAFFSGRAGGEVDYDARQRERAVEENPGAAIEVMRELLHQLEAMREADLDTRMRIRMDDGGDSSWSETTLRRELQFLLGHTIHHYALSPDLTAERGTRNPERQ